MADLAAGSTVANRPILTQGSSGYLQSLLFGDTNAGAGLVNSEGGSLELGDILGYTGGSTGRTAWTPFIDFHYGKGTAQDYNVRLINNIDGQLTFVGTLLQVNGALSTTGNFTVNTDKFSASSTGNVAMAGNLNVNGGTVTLGATGSNVLSFGTAGVAAPSIANTRTTGTKLVLYSSYATSKLDFALGIDSSTMWFSVYDTGCQYRWYAGDTTLKTLATLSGTGVFNAVGGLQVNGTDVMPKSGGAFTGGISGTTAGFSGDFAINSTKFTVAANNGNTTAAGTLTVNGGTVTLGNATSNLINFGTAGYTLPSLTTRANGTKIVLFSSVAADKLDYAIGIENGGLWMSTRDVNDLYKWYCGQATTPKLLATLSGAGVFNSTGELQVSGKNVRPKVADITIRKGTTSYTWTHSLGCTYGVSLVNMSNPSRHVYLGALDANSLMVCLDDADSMTDTVLRVTITPASSFETLTN